MTSMASLEQPESRAVPAIVRRLVGVLALIELGIGAWQLFAPHSFYTWFPAGRGWVARLGPYDQHLVTDIGELTLALGVVLALATIFSTTRLVQAALAGYLVQALPHLIFHSIHREHLTTADNAANLVVLGFAVLVSGALLALTIDAPRRNSRLVAARRGHVSRGSGAPNDEG